MRCTLFSCLPRLARRRGLEVVWPTRGQVDSIATVETLLSHETEPLSVFSIDLLLLLRLALEAHSLSTSVPRLCSWRGGDIQHAAMSHAVSSYRVAKIIREAAYTIAGVFFPILFDGISLSDQRWSVNRNPIAWGRERSRAGLRHRC